MDYIKDTHGETSPASIPTSKLHDDLIMQFRKMCVTLHHIVLLIGFTLFLYSLVLVLHLMKTLMDYWNSREINIHHLDVPFKIGIIVCSWLSILGVICAAVAIAMVLLAIRIRKVKNTNISDLFPIQ